MIPWANPTHHPKRQLDRFSHFLTADAAFFLHVTLRLAILSAPLPPDKNAPPRGIQTAV